MTIHVLTRWAKTELPSIDVTSSGGNGAKFSPFLLGPVQLYDNMWSRNMENGWQYSKVYPQHDTDSLDYWTWALEGWNNKQAVRYPMGKGVKPLYSLWAGEKLDYVTARKRIYIPLYSQAVRFHSYQAFLELKDFYADEKNIVIRDYDAYDHHALGYSWDDVMNDPDRKMGHGFVLAMMLEGYL